MNSFKLIVLTSVWVSLACTSSAYAQNVSVVSGNGQILTASNLLVQPLVAQVTDANGNPLPGATLNWNSNGFSGYFYATATNQFTAVTDQNGQSTAYFFISPNALGTNILSPLVQTAVTATTTTGNSATFTLTQLVAAANPGFAITPQVLVNSIAVPTGTVLKGAVGTTYSPPIQIQVSATNGLANSVIPNAAVQLLNLQDPGSGPAVGCQTAAGGPGGSNTVITDSNGFATCTPVFGGQPGNGRFVLVVGNAPAAIVTPSGFWQQAPDPTDPTIPQLQGAWISFIPIAISETAGLPGSIKVSSGSGQTANPGYGLGAPLVAEVDDVSGKPLGSASVKWTVSPAGAAVLGTPQGTSNANGLVSTSVTLTGTAPTTGVTVTASLLSDPTKTATFTIQVTIPVTITSFTAVSGSGQTAPPNTAFVQPLIVQVTASAGSPAGVAVTFSTSGGSIVLTSNATPVTDSNGRAQVTVQAGSGSGPASVTATISGASPVTFSLTVGPRPPTITAANFINGADYQANSLSPCSVGALVVPAGALAVSDSSPTFPGLPVPSNLLQLTFNNSSAPILNIGPSPTGQQQVTFQVPCDAAPGASVPVALSVGGGGASTVNLTLQAASPGVFQTLMSDGVLRGVFVRPDGSFVSLQNPARRGETEIALATGLGPTSPSVGTTSVPAPGVTANVSGTVVAGMNGGGVPLVYARLSEDLTGVFVVAFQIPSTMITGSNVGFSIGLVPVGASTAIYSGLAKIPVQ